MISATFNFKRFLADPNGSKRIGFFAKNVGLFMQTCLSTAMRKMVILTLLILCCPAAADAAGQASNVLVADFYGDSALMDTGAGIAAACRASLGPSSVPVTRIINVMKDQGMDPAEGLFVPRRAAARVAQASGAIRLVTGRLYVSQTGTALVLRFVDRQGATVAVRVRTVPCGHAWTLFIRQVMETVAREVGTRKLKEPPELTRLSLQSYGRACRMQRAGDFQQAVTCLGRTFERNPALARFLETGKGLEALLFRSATTNRQKAQVLLAVGKAREAARLLSLEARKTEGNTELQLAYGQALLQSGKADRALRVFTPLAEAVPERSDIRVSLAVAQAAAGKVDQADAGLRELIASEPENADAKRALAGVLNETGQKKAAAVLNEAAGKVLAFQGRLDSANEAIMAVLAQDPGNTSAMENLRPEYLTVNQARELQAQLLNDLDEMDREPSLQYAQGMVLAREGRQEEAGREFEKVLSARPGHPGASREFGRIQASRGNHKEAVAHLERASSTLNDPEIDFLLALEYEVAGEPDKALELLEKVERSSEQPHLEAATRKSLLQLEQGNAPEAQKSLEQVVRLCPDHAAAHRGLARALGMAGRVERARLEMREAALLDPGEVEVSAYSMGIAEPLKRSLIRTQLAPFSEELVEALLQLFQSFGDLDHRPKEIRKLLTVGIQVTGLENQPFFQVFLLSPKRISHEAAFVLNRQMGYPGVISFQALPEGSDPSNKNEVLGRLLGQGVALQILLAVKREEERLQIDAKLYDAATGNLWRNSAEVDLISFSPIEEINKLLVGILSTPFFLLLLVVLYPVIRGNGTLIVEETHDPNVERAFFSVLISRRKLGPPLKKGDEMNYLETVAAQGRKKSRFQANMVGRHTLFEKIPPNSYFVYFYGVLVDGGVPIGSYSLEKQVRIRRRRRERVNFDLTPKEATIHVQTFCRGEPCYGAEVWVNEDRYHSVYTKDGSSSVVDGVLIRVPKGKQVIHVSHDDLSTSRTLAIEDLNRISLFVEITEPDDPDTP